MTDDPTPIISSGFSISGTNLVPDECTKEMDLQPTSVGLAGTKRRPDALTTLRTSYWSISFSKEASYDLDEGLAKVLEIMWPKRRKVLGYLRAGSYDEVGFFSTVNIYVDRPLYRIRPDVLRHMAFFGVKYTFDVHDYSD